jgi:CheY-like chemotaxis protein
VESEVDTGTVFRVHLPAQPDLRAEQPQAEAPSMPRGHGETVLVVDDEESVLQLVQKTLEKFGYNVLTARNGEEGLATYVGNQAAIAIVLTDLMMPVMDGAATIRALKQINPQVKVIAASGLGSDPNRNSVRDLGVKHFVPKPYTAETILQKLQEALAEEPEQGT